MRNRPNHIMTVAAILAAGTVLQPGAQAQSADALIDKLVDKGVLTVKEANELREEADKGFTTAYQVKSGMPDWVTSFKINGDMRGRFESFNAQDEFVDRNRFRYRLRLGAVATLKDNFEVGTRFTSSERTDNFGGDPISGNTTFGDNGSKKFVFLDLAYARWYAVNNQTWSATSTIGKMENPFTWSEMVFDADYTPEGLAQQFGYNLSETQKLSLNVAGFALDEVGTDNEDPYMFGAQLRWDANWSTKLQSAVAVGALAIHDNHRLDPTGTAAAGLTQQVPDVNFGNSRNVDGRLLNDYNPLIADASVTYNLESAPLYNALFPITLRGEAMHNPAADNNNNAYALSLTLGKSGKRGLWDVSYKWKHLEGDAWYEEVVDSDFGGYYPTAAANARYRAGTNLEGHIFKFTYSPSDSLTLGVTYFLVDVINEVPAGRHEEMGRLQLDAVWKF